MTTPSSVRIFASAVIALCIAGTQSSCSSPGPTSTTAANGNILLTLSEPEGVLLDAKIEGKLAITTGKCLGLESTDGTLGPAIFPVGTSLSDDGGSVTVPGLGELAIGDAFSGSGGSIEVINAPVDVPDECVGADESVYILNPT